MGVEIKPTGELLKNSLDLIRVMDEYVVTYNIEHNNYASHPITWLETDDGELIVHIEKEYAEKFKQFLAQLG